jgi:hypothetical protein
LDRFQYTSFPAGGADVGHYVPVIILGFKEPIIFFD